MSIRVLFLTTRNVKKPAGGGELKTFKMISHLRGIYDLNVICLGFKSNIDQYETGVYALDRGVSGRSLYNLVRSYFHGQLLSVYRNKSSSLFSKISDIAVNYDVIFVDHYVMYQYVLEFTNAKIILHQHNAEYLMWERLAELEANRIKRFLIRLEAKRIRGYEKKICKHATKILAAPNDIEALSEPLGIPVNKFEVTYHLGDDSLLGLPSLVYEETKMKLLFLGTMTWQANIDAVSWFLRDVWPVIIQKNSGILFEIVGNIDSRNKAKFESYDGVSVLGFVEDINKVFTNARIFVSPLRFGSGMKVKNVTAMYRGLPMVTSDVGAEGIGLSNGINVLIANNSAEFISAIQSLLDDQSLWENLSLNSREYAEVNLSWESVLDSINDIVNTVAHI